MHQYIDLNRVEFVVTNACSGRCRHCSNGEHGSGGGSVDANAAIAVIKRLTGKFTIQSVMTFGGEPLLFPDTVCKIHAVSCGCGIPQRQLITNGFFTNDERKIDEVAKAIIDSGVNDILLSVDVFHQEYIPLNPVMRFAEALLKYNTPSLRIQPAWVVNKEHNNPYNTETKRLIKIFTDKGVRVNEGNNIFPSGNALRNLGEYFTPPENVDLSVPCGSAPYTSRLDDISCISINPQGDVDLCSISIGNIYAGDIMKIVDTYNPYDNPAYRAVLDKGVPGLLSYATVQGVGVDISDCRSACGVCHKTMAALKSRALL